MSSSAEVRTDQWVLQLMMTLKVTWNAKVTRASTDRRPVRSAADNNSSIQHYKTNMTSHYVWLELT